MLGETWLGKHFDVVGSPHTLNPKPYTLIPTSEILIHKPQTQNPKPYTLSES